MSLLQGLHSPRTPLRLFLDREATAGTWPLRATYRSRLAPGRLAPPREGVGTEAGTVGTAIDQRLRLGFTLEQPVDEATRLGITALDASLGANAAPPRSPRRGVLAALGIRLCRELADLACQLDLADRNQPLMRAQDEEERLARILLCAAWYAVHFRNPFAFPYTPLFNAAAEQGHRLTWERMLQIPTQDLVDDLLAQLDAAEDSPLERLRLGCIPHDCAPGPTFDGSRDVTADADLIVDGTLIDFKSARHLRNFPKTTIYQLLSYTLLDYSDHHRIDSVGVYMTRGSALVTWPIEDYLALLGTRRRDLIELRAVFQRLLSEPDWHADQEPFDPVQHESVRKVLDGFFADPPPPGCCHVCAQPIAAASQRRRYCSQHCSNRSDYYQRRGWL